MLELFKRILDGPVLSIVVAERVPFPFEFFPLRIVLFFEFIAGYRFRDAVVTVSGFPELDCGCF
jgi:hypothetical protein